MKKGNMSENNTKNLTDFISGVGEEPEQESTLVLTTKDGELHVGMTGYQETIDLIVKFVDHITDNDDPDFKAILVSEIITSKMTMES